MYDVPNSVLLKTWLRIGGDYPSKDQHVAFAFGIAVAECKHALRPHVCQEDKNVS